MLIQHSHSPCISENFLVSKLDHFVLRGPNDPVAGGLLRELRQGEDNLFLVFSRSLSRPCCPAVAVLLTWPLGDGPTNERVQRLQIRRSLRQ
jgi:hypothetical protein